MLNRSRLIGICLLLALAGAAWGQDTFTGFQGQPTVFKGLTATPAPLMDLSIQIPGNAELNGSIRISTASGSACLSSDDASLRIFWENNCNRVYEPGLGESFIDAGPIGSGCTDLNDCFLQNPVISAASCGNPLIVANSGSFNPAIDPYWEVCVDPNDGPIMRAFCAGVLCPFKIDRTGGSITIADADFGVNLSGGAQEVHPIGIDAGSMTSDPGKLCGDPQETLINGAFPTLTRVCADDDNASLYFKIPTMPKKWNEGTFTVTAVATYGGAPPQGDYVLAWSMQCRSTGEEFDATFGAEQNTLFDFGLGCGGQCEEWSPVHIESAAITPNGSPCGEGDSIIVRAHVVALATTSIAANVHFLGGNINWTANDWTE